jgi:hypothetical protein
MPNPIALWTSLTKWPEPGWTDVDHRPLVDREIDQQRPYELEHLRVATGHEARAVASTGDPARCAHVQEVDATRGETGMVAFGLAPERVAAVDDHVGRVQPVRECLDGLLDGRAMRDVQQDHSWWAQLGHQLVEGRCRVGTDRCECFRLGHGRAVADDLVAGAQGLP